MKAVRILYPLVRTTVPWCKRHIREHLIQQLSPAASVRDGNLSLGVTLWRVNRTAVPGERKPK